MAKEEYLNEVFLAIHEQYRDIDTFLCHGLNIPHNLIEKFQKSVLLKNSGLYVEQSEIFSRLVYEPFYDWKAISGEKVMGNKRCWILLIILKTNTMLTDCISVFPWKIQLHAKCMLLLVLKKSKRLSHTFLDMQMKEMQMVKEL